MTATQLVGQAARFGFVVMRTPTSFTLRPKKADAALPDWLRAKLADNKQAVIDWLDRVSLPPADLPDDPRPDVIAVPPPGEPKPPPAMGSPVDRWGWAILRAGAGRPCRDAELVGPEHGTCALVAVLVTPADLIPWEEVRHPERNDLPPSFRLDLPRITARLTGSRFVDLFPAA